MRTFLALIISAAIAVPVLAMPPGDGSHMLKAMTRHLDLSAEQQAQVKTVLEAKKPKMDAIREQMEALKTETDGEIKALLTAEQLEKFAVMQEKRKERFQSMRENHERKFD